MSENTLNQLHPKLLQAIETETQNFKQCYLWLEQAMPQSFLTEISPDNLNLIAHALMGFDKQDHFSTIHLKHAALVLCIDSPDADLRILKNYSMYGIKNYQTFVSKIPPPLTQVKDNLRIAIIDFTRADFLEENEHLALKENILELIKQRNPKISAEELERLVAGLSVRFEKALSPETFILALDLFFRAQTRDHCQYEVRYDHEWEQNNGPSMEIVLAWRNTPKHHFLYRLARTIHRNGLMMKRVTATYINPYSKNSILIMILGLHGSEGQAAWNAANIRHFLRELVTVKYFASFDLIDQLLVNKGIIPGFIGNVLRAMINFIHQNLVNIDANLYTIENIEEGLCRHPELTALLCEAFTKKFDPEHVNLEAYQQIHKDFLLLVAKLDTGQVENDNRRKNILLQGMNMVHHTLKTNAFRTNYTSLSFRLNPKYLDHIPFDRQKKFPELPFGIFYIKGMHFFGYHIRFKDLARGGLRTVFPAQSELVTQERNNVFTECYNLAWTQHMKNKDIPEGGAKGIIFLKPYDRLESETEILKRELEESGIAHSDAEKKLDLFREEQVLEYLYQAQRSFIESLLTIVNCDQDGKIRAKYVIDFWNKPEYLYLGPDENMHDPLIQWIAAESKKFDYKPGGSFISSKPGAGINHKEYGVTSLGVNVYMHEALKYIGINPLTDTFTVKMSGGPDGDVAGNQILNLQRFYPNKAKLLSLIDVSGTIHDPVGLDLNTMVQLQKDSKPCAFYPPEQLNEGGFLLDKNTKRSPTHLVQQTLCWRKKGGKLVEEWVSGSEMNYLLRTNVHQTKTDVFIPSGGRPRTLNEENIKDFLDETGKPTSKVIVEGANLYLTPFARKFLEDLDVLIIKDSSANKTGVICSSFEVLCGLTLGDDLFMSLKPQLVREILERLQLCAFKEANLLLKTYEETDEYLTDISDEISRKINQYTYGLLNYLETIPLIPDPKDPLMQCFLAYCLPTLRTKFQKELIENIPEHHKKAIIACHIGANAVYQKGLKWSPSIVDILPILLKEVV